MHRDQWRHLTWWKNQMGDRLLADVRPSLPAEYRDRLSNGEGRPKSTATVVIFMAALSHAFSMVVIIKVFLLQPFFFWFVEGDCFFGEK
jgi:hypothetical protein